MRKLLWFTVGFTAICAVSAYLFSGIALLILGLILGVTVLLCGWLFKDKVRVFCCVLIGAILGCVYCFGYEKIAFEPAKEYDTQTIEATVIAQDFSFSTGYGCAVDGKITLDEKTYQIRLYLDPCEISPGDTITGNIKLRYTGSGGMQDSTYHVTQGIFLLGYVQDDANIQRSNEDYFAHFVPNFRKDIGNILLEAFEEDTAPFALALLLGDDRQLTFEQDASFQISGIRHVIAVSGFHVAVLFGLIYLLCGNRRGLIALLGLPMLVLFCAVAGFTPSVVRACIMQALMILALLVDREYDPPSALAFSALVMLVVNPQVIASIGFQLSIGCMIGIFAFCGKLRAYLVSKIKAKERSFVDRALRWLASSVSVTISAMSVTVPLCAIYFRMVSLIGIITNMLTLSVVTIVFYGLMIVVLLGAVSIPLAQVVAWLASWPARYVLVTSKLMAQVPFGTVYIEDIYGVLFVVLTYVLIFAFFITKRKHPIQLTAGIAVLLVLTFLMGWAEPRLDNFRMTVLDVGQGQCILLSSGNDHYIVDCGGDDPAQTAMTAIRTLRSQGIYQIDGIILTHYDKDHAGAASNVMDFVDVDAVYMPDTDEDSILRQELENAEQVQLVRRKLSLPCGKGKIDIFPAPSGGEGNESSMCILFCAENCDILITGDRNIDGERQLLEEYSIPDIEVLVAGHHGADTSTGLELLHFTKPEVAVISVGKDNLYGHPHSATIKRLSNMGCLIRRTDREGTIIIRG